VTALISLAHWKDPRVSWTTPSDTVTGYLVGLC